jgi:hypothetical protein
MTAGGELDGPRADSRDPHLVRPRLRDDALVIEFLHDSVQRDDGVAVSGGFLAGAGDTTRWFALKMPARRNDRSGTLTNCPVCGSENPRARTNEAEVDELPGSAEGAKNPRARTNEAEVDESSGSAGGAKNPRARTNEAEVDELPGSAGAEGFLPEVASQNH